MRGKGRRCTPFAFALSISSFMTPLAPLPRYNVERARRLHRICIRLQIRLASGDTFLKASHRLASLWNGKPYKSCPNRCYRISPGMLYRAYRKWLANPVSETFNLNYRWNTRNRTAHYCRFADDLTVICLRPEITNMAMAVRQLRQKHGNTFSQRTGCRFFTQRQKLAANKVLKLHRDLNEAALALKAVCETTVKAP
jgi:hypothetical protein